MIPTPVLTTADEAEAGPSTPTPLSKRTRGGAKRMKKVSTGTSAEPTTADEGDSLPVVKKQKTGSKAM